LKAFKGNGKFSVHIPSVGINQIHLVMNGKGFLELCCFFYHARSTLRLGATLSTFGRTGRGGLDLPLQGAMLVAVLGLDLGTRQVRTLLVLKQA
jgi:hypothetical protein